MKSPSTAALAGVMLLAACAGREANPVSEYQPGDDEKSCQRLQSEIEQVDAEIRAMLPDTDKTGQNVALGVAGAFLIVPWFFMDFSEAEKIEVKALRRRYNHLVLLGREKDCGFEYEAIPPLEEGALPKPSSAETPKPA